ncbi:MAG: OmpA family protein, partial [Hyphomicrobiaceae bacterium]|nr:OmpA family protein [Hyphomicrobiaceae bacterium]
ALEAVGSTPLAQSIMSVETIVRENPNQTTIVLVSDGDESCGGNPCAEATRLKQDYAARFKIYTIGYSVDGKTQRELKCIASASGGQYLKADNSFILQNSIHTIVVNEVTKSFDADLDGVTNDKDRCPNTLPGFSVDSSGCEDHYTIRINFGLGSSDIRSDFYPTIKRFATFMAGNTFRARIEGHTDATGGHNANQILSEKRALAVLEKLVEFGIARERLTSSGFGSGKPVADNATNAGRFRNRRVEARLTKP